jgi:hypothetical protein
MPNKVYCRLLPLTKILEEKDVLSLQDPILRTHDIVREAYQFIKAYCLYEFEMCCNIHPIDRSFIKIVFSLITEKKVRRGTQPVLYSAKGLKALVRIF